MPVSVGNITTRLTEHGVTTYDYDLLDRLTRVDNPTLADEAFTYDDVGNRLTSSDTTGAWQYNGTNQLLNDTLHTYQYDDNGSQVKKTNTGSGDIQEFIYNLENRIDTVKVNTVATASYYYDPFGRRLWKEVGGVRTYALYAPEGMVAEYDNTGTLMQSYGYVPEVTYGTQPLFTANATTTGYYQLDQLGTPQQLTTSTGAVAWSAQYQSFGQASVTSSSLNNDLRFPGQRYDAETG
ncbi:MAG: RHS domain-containing protein, partial [Gammaproteobacteria bacterium]